MTNSIKRLSRLEVEKLKAKGTNDYSGENLHEDQRVD
jgi:hypothetical protein